MKSTCMDRVEVEYINGWLNWRYDYAHIRYAIINGKPLVKKTDADEITWADVLEKARACAKRKYGLFNTVDAAIEGCGDFGPEYLKAFAENDVDRVSNSKLWHITQLLCMGARLPYRVGIEWYFRQVAPTNNALAVLSYDYDMTMPEAKMPKPSKELEAA